MRKIRAAAITGLVLATLGALLWFSSSTDEREPVYQGKTLTYWLSDFWPGRTPSPEKAEQDRRAVRQIGTNAIPTLLQWISARDRPLKRKMVSWIYGHPWVPFRLESSLDKNMLAVSGFGILGKSQAGAAVPALIEIVKAGGGEKISGYHNVTFPMLALADLDPQAATNAGILFATDGAVIGWSAPASKAGSGVEETRK